MWLLIVMLLRAVEGSRKETTAGMLILTYHWSSVLQAVDGGDGGDQGNEDDDGYGLNS